MDILRVVSDGPEGPTQIMYKANLSWVTVSEHLKALLGLGFLEASLTSSRNKYSLTKRGLGAVRTYRNLLREIYLPLDPATPSLLESEPVS